MAAAPREGRLGKKGRSSPERPWDWEQRSPVSSRRRSRRLMRRREVRSDGARRRVDSVKGDVGNARDANELRPKP